MSADEVSEELRASLQSRRVETTLGELVFTAPRAVWDSSEPATVLIHGAAGRMPELAWLAQALPRPVLAGLPGHRVPALGQQ